MIVSRETHERLIAYEALVRKWNAKINLVAPSTLPEFNTRHIQDSIQIFNQLQFPEGNWVDLGSGGGLPGVVVSIYAQKAPLTVSLVESDQRKSAFLRTVIRELSLQNVSILTGRIENVPPLGANFVSARALAPLSALLSMVQRHMHQNGTAIFLKGRSWKAECAEARKEWRFDVTSFPSKTDPDAAILKITGVSHA
ncbi:MULTISPECIES: 16S rRNA (guanine(527)-N(7))-methyltransferase RsmG [Paracoccus]|uniref:16S rRNA (guanine(527)-N(7))-methyltransferase RsmG n=1 Tax=Paracoccus TaxID=265 RepID=UPI000A02E0BC|nr:MULTISPECIES: 16S rRNA (guanine(527)-N(7))-methyltransferase RsmG [Paracoccus]MBF5079085.1 16S rRNA (guanine(527)-N(7))-methyltransferase RsmG [Paracoccus sp. NBH48]|tara:strand:- start:3543 stop:4133 length:591 start_codon:yes stop_codon:yes gene_type:complete